MLVPLETLAGWPTAEDPSALQLLGLLIGFPVLAIVIAVAVAKIGNAAKSGRTSAIERSDPVWVGGRRAAPEENLDEDGNEITSDSGSESGSGAPGGASARW